MCDNEISSKLDTLTQRIEEIQLGLMSKPRVLITHPGKSCYYDDSIWIPLSYMDDEGCRGVWLKPGQAIAVIELPKVEPTKE